MPSHTDVEILSFNRKYTHMHTNIIFPKGQSPFETLLNKVPNGVGLLLTHTLILLFPRTSLFRMVLMGDQMVLASRLHHLKVEKNPLQLQLLVKVCLVGKRLSSVKSKHEIFISSSPYLKLNGKTFPHNFNVETNSKLLSLQQRDKEKEAPFAHSFERCT